MSESEPFVPSENAMASMRRASEQIGCSLDTNENDPLHFRLSPIPFFTLHLTFTDSDRAFAYINCRTTSWHFDGERTDLHEVLSVLLAAFLQTLTPSRYSCRLWDVFNPAVPVPEVELYARILTLSQPDGSVVNFGQDDVNVLTRLLGQILAFHYSFSRVFCPRCCNEGDEDRRYSSEKLSAWRRHCDRALGEVTRDFDDCVQYNLRRSPDWHYYRNFRRKVTVLRHPLLGPVLGLALKEDTPWQEIKGVGSTLLVGTDNVNNVISDKVRTFAAAALARLNQTGEQTDIALIPIENQIIAASGSYALFIEAEAGLKTFENTREQIRLRRQTENELLFPFRSFNWSSTIDDDEFERFTLEALRRHPNVVWIRKVSHSRERDGGRDLIAEWITTPDGPIPVGDSPANPRRVVVQCKVSTSSVGKSDVKDIRDTLEYFDATGYFLVVSSQLATSLTDHLDAIRRRGQYWVDWWTRAEFENHITRHRELLTMFPSVVTAEQED